MTQVLSGSGHIAIARQLEQLSIAEWGERKSTTIIGTHPLLAEALERVVRLARSESPVLITGETGTGKELFARSLFLSAHHHRRVFLSVNCAQYCGTELVASELFGHRKGAFTGAQTDHRGIFEEADGGTVFLDEIGELPLTAQAMLLRALGEGEVVPVGGNRTKQVNVRVIAATSRDLKPMIAEGKFRSDLYYRLRQLHLQIPPLRDRGDDWRIIADHYLDRLSTRASTRKGFSSDALSTLKNHSWPGNVREVRSVVDTGFHLSTGVTIGVEDFCEAMEELLRDQQLDQLAAILTADCCNRMAAGEHSFWQAVHRPFLDRELNRNQVRAIVAEGLQLAHGSYKRMLDVFGIPQSDYLKLMDFLRHHDLKPEVYRSRPRVAGAASSGEMHHS